MWPPLSRTYGACSAGRLSPSRIRPLIFTPAAPPPLLPTLVLSELKLLYYLLGVALKRLEMSQ
jgi:hypothetical protein